jgi:hypothetical protein
MSLHELCNDFNRDTYNGLPGVETADELARSGDRLDNFLDSAARLFVRHNMHDRFGVGLLHKHNMCEPGERMIQYNCTVDDEMALVTLPQRKEVDIQAEVPNVWLVSGNGFTPLEYSTDAYARSSFFSGDIPTSFLADFADLIRISSVQDIFGLAIVNRTLSQLAEPNQVLLEQSDLIKRNSIVFLRDRAQTTTSITTGWSFEKYAQSNGITAGSGCTTTHRCQCVSQQGKHSHVSRPHHIPRPGSAIL